MREMLAAVLVTLLALGPTTVQASPPGQQAELTTGCVPSRIVVKVGQTVCFRALRGTREAIIAASNSRFNSPAIKALTQTAVWSMQEGEGYPFVEDVGRVFCTKPRRRGSLSALYTIARGVTNTCAVEVTKKAYNPFKDWKFYVGAALGSWGLSKLGGEGDPPPPPTPDFKSTPIPPEGGHV